jgi:hypothetical protein
MPLGMISRIDLLRERPPGTLDPQSVAVQCKEPA